jgi:hypothetical protein
MSPTRTDARTSRKKRDHQHQFSVHRQQFQCSCVLQSVRCTLRRLICLYCSMRSASRELPVLQCVRTNTKPQSCCGQFPRQHRRHLVEVRPVLVMQQSDRPAADGSSGIASSRLIDEAGPRAERSKWGRTSFYFLVANESLTGSPIQSGFSNASRARPPSFCITMTFELADTTWC